MQVHKIYNRCNNLTFGKIILDCTYPVKAEIPANKLLHSKTKLNELKSTKPDEFRFLEDTLSEVIEYDFRDSAPKFWNRFQELVKSQENNPHNIHLDVFLADEGEIPLYSEGWYQRATVGDKIFRQRVYEFEGTAIQFLEDACKHANELLRKKVDPEETAAKTAINVEKDVPRKTTLKGVFQVLGHLLG